MSDNLFADAVRSISISNGVLRVEFVQMKQKPNERKLTPEPAGTLIMPATALPELKQQLEKTLEAVRQKQREQQGDKGESAIEDALGKI